MSQKDITEKMLFTYNDVFADVVNALLFKGEQVIAEEELVDQAPRAAYKADGVIRDIERDVAKRWLKNNIRIACIGIENQTEPDQDMAIRVFSYDSAEYRAQLLKENRRNPRYPVVTIVLYFGYKKHWDEPQSLLEAVTVPDILRPYVSDIKINLYEIAFLKDEQLEYFRSDFRVVADYFSQMRKNNKYVPSTETLKHVEAVLQLLSVMTQDTRFEDVLKQEKGSEGGVHNMCEVLDRVEAIGMEKGEKKGEIKGAIRIYREEMNLSPAEIVRKLVTKFTLDEKEAWEYVNTAMDVQQ